MHNDMPPLVNAHGGGGFDGDWGFPASPPPAAHPSAGATPWQGVMPGGFGAGTPHPRQRQHLHPHATPARSHHSFNRSPSMGHNVINPLLAAQPQPGVDPFSIPAAAFDQGQGSQYQYQYPPGAFGHSPGPAAWQPFGGDPSPPPLGMPSPWHAATPRTHQQDPGDGEDEPPGPGGWGEPWGTWGNNAYGHSPGSSSGAGPSPSASVINGFASGPRSQYKRPGDWRPGFSMSRPGALTRVFSLGSGGGLFSKPSLNKIIDAKERSCTWDIRRPPELFLVLPDQRPLDFLQLQEGAMKPEPVRMKVTHPMLPWTIHVTAGGPGSGCVITIGHLLASIHAELMRPIFQCDFWNDEVSEEHRKKIHDAWATRCAGDRALAAQGIKRVDYLLDRWVFEGLRRVGDSWEMKLKSGRRHV